MAIHVATSVKHDIEVRTDAVIVKATVSFKIQGSIPLGHQHSKPSELQ
jgi:hypothetical protein